MPSISAVCTVKEEGNDRLEDGGMSALDEETQERKGATRR